MQDRHDPASRHPRPAYTVPRSRPTGAAHPTAQADQRHQALPRDRPPEGRDSYVLFCSARAAPRRSAANAPVARIKKTAVKRPATATSTKSKAAKQQVQTKFKIRCSRYLYTLVLHDAEKAEKLKQSLPPGLKVEEISTKAAPKK